MAGSMARGVAQTVLHPIDVVRTRLQAKGVARNWQPQVFAKGVIPQIVLAIPAGGLQFVAFEWCKAKLAALLLAPPAAGTPSGGAGGSHLRGGWRLGRFVGAGAAGGVEAAHPGGHLPRHRCRAAGHSAQRRHRRSVPRLLGDGVARRALERALVSVLPTRGAPVRARAASRAHTARKPVAGGAGRHRRRRHHDPGGCGEDAPDDPETGRRLSQHPARFPAHAQAGVGRQRALHPGDAHRHREDGDAAVVHHLVPAGAAGYRQADLLHTHGGRDGEGAGGVGGGRTVPRRAAGAAGRGRAGALAGGGRTHHAAQSVLAPAGGAV
eukprot:ctg_110.g45